VLQHDCQEFLALLLDSLHEHLNSPGAAVSATHKLTNTDHNESFSHQSAEFSDVDAESGDVGCPDYITLVADAPTGELLGSFLSRNQQLLLEMGTEDGSCSETDQLQSAMDTQECDEEEDMDGISSVSVDECGRKVPSIEDFCSKDTKTLNTNVLIAEPTEELATDSEKFHKMENTAEHCATSAAESLDDDEVTTDGQLHELLLAACDGSVSKPVKETNFVSNCREKFVDSVKLMHPVTTYALASAADVECFISTMKQFCGKPAGITTTDEPDDDVQNYDNINNIKRIKIDDQAAEKNLRMQVKLKVNTEQNQTRSSSPLVADCTAVPVDQLTASSSSPAATSTVGSQTFPPSAASCSGDVIAAHHVRRAETAWLAYMSRNRSVIVDTFQGQFKSTVSNPQPCLLFV